MSVILVFLLVIFGIAGWWLSHQRLMAKPWLEQGSTAPHFPAPNPADAGGKGRARRISRRRRLPVCAVHQRLFHAHGAVGLAAAAGAAPAVAQHRRAGAEQRRAAMRAGCGAQAARWIRSGSALVTAGLTALGFPGRPVDGVAGTDADGYLLTANPANSFFYLITGMHGLHILGGLVALGRTTVRAWTRRDAATGCVSASSCAPCTGISCCSSGSPCSCCWPAGPQDFIDICRQLLT